MTAVCLKTGADVYLAEHHALCHGDLFQVGQTYILALSGTAEQCMNYDVPQDFKCDMVTYNYHNIGSRCVAWESRHCGGFLYDGYQPNGG